MTNRCLERLWKPPVHLSYASWTAFILLCNSGVLVHSLVREMNFFKSSWQTEKGQVTVGAVSGQTHTTACSRFLWCCQVWARSKTLTFLVFCLVFKLSSASVVLPTASQIQQRFRCFSDKDLKTCQFNATRNKTSFFFSRKVNHAGIMLSLFVGVSNNIPKCIRPACRDYCWTFLFLLITIQMMIKVWA